MLPPFCVIQFRYNCKVQIYFSTLLIVKYMTSNPHTLTLVLSNPHTNMRVRVFVVKAHFPVISSHAHPKRLYRGRNQQVDF